MTIPDVGRCLGSGKPPRAGSSREADGAETGVCVTCSGRFELQDGDVVDHETAEVESREELEST